MRVELFVEATKSGQGCASCGYQFLSMAEMIRDHVIPLGEGGADEVENTQALCIKCSDIKTHAESMRGRGAS